MGRKLGHTVSEKTKKKISDKLKQLNIMPPSRKGIKCKEEWIKKRIQTRKNNNYHHTITTRLKMSKSAHRGCENHFWKGGITPLRNAIESSLKYKQWRQEVFIRDNFTCQKCKNKGGYLHSHHKKKFSIMLDEIKQNLPLLSLYEGAMIYSPLWDLDNGITLCEKCHKKIHHKK